MFTLKSAVLAVAAAFVTIARADYQIDPNTVPLGLRQAWCDSEKSTCPLICQQEAPRTTLINDCNPKTLQYGCLCGNNKQPNISEYTLTMPYFICQEFGNQCVKACGINNECSNDCRENNPCGASAPKRYNSTTTASSPSATETNEDALYTDTPGGKSKSKKDKDNAAPAMLDVGRTYGLAVVLGSMFVGFAML